MFLGGMKKSRLSFSTFFLIITLINSFAYISLYRKKPISPSTAYYIRMSSYYPPPQEGYAQDGQPLYSQPPPEGYYQPQPPPQTIVIQQEAPQQEESSCCDCSCCWAW